MRVITTLVLLVAYSALGEEKQPSLRVAVPGLRGVRLTDAELEFYSEHLAQSLRAPGIVVVTAREISTLLGIERQKQLLGCGEGSCITELANALGADALVLGDVVKIDDTYQVNVELIAPLDVAVLAQGTRRVTGQLQSLDAVASLARELARGLLQKKGRVVPPELRAEAPGGGAGPPKAWAWVPLGAGVAAAGFGVALLSLAEGDAAQLRASGPELTDGDAMKLRDQGKSFQAVGAVCLGVGLAAALAGVGLVAFGPRDAPSIAVVPVREGAVFSLSGALP